MVLQSLNQVFFSEFLAAIIQSLGHAVGVQREQISG
jgi:hypothetical protein